LDHEEIVHLIVSAANNRASNTLRKLHDTLDQLLNDKDTLQTRLSQELGTPLHDTYSSRR